MPVRASLDVVVQDVTFALRQLRGARSFTIAAVATLAIGVGATAAVYGLLDAVVLRPMPFVQPDRVVNLHPARDGNPIATASGLEFATWRALPGVFTGVAAYAPQQGFILDRGDTPEVVSGTRASADFTRVLGLTPELGRTMMPSEDVPGGPRVVLLAHGLWMRLFHGDRAAIGTPLRLNGESYTVIGVMPPRFDEVSGGDQLIAPLALSSAALLDFKARTLQLVGRLAPGVSLEHASSTIDAAEQRLAAQYPMWGRGYTAQVRRYADDLIGNLRARLFILLGAVSFVFLIACVNVANLLLARGGARAREMAIRAALGAERARLVRQLLTECGVLCAIAGTLGVILAVGIVRGLVAMSPPGVPRVAEARVDGGVVAFTFAVAALCIILVGLLPALRGTSTRLESALREGARGTSDGPTRERGRVVLVAAEVALAMALLTGAGLLLRTAWSIGHVDPGFDSANVLTAQVLLPPARYPDLGSGARAYRAIRDQVASTPGVRVAAITSSAPLGGAIRAGIGAEGHPMTDGERLIVDLRIVSPHYFATLGIRLRAGRDFTTADGASAPNVAIIDEALARRLWPGQTAIGKRIEGMDPSHQHFMTIVGVAAEARDVGLDQAPAAEFYIPIEQMPPAIWHASQGALAIVARTAAAPAAMERPVRRAVAAVDPSLPIASVSTMDALVRSSRAAARFNTMLLTALGAIALVLAAVGVYGVIAYSVSQRTREIGLRMALGATPAAIAMLVVRRGLAPIVVGAAAGALMSLVATRVLREQLYGVAPGDPATIAAIAALLLAVSFAAALIPARRAMRIPPVRALIG
ncbi:MAG TPA: ABC transporter permease [Gemmatimonadaceae bacterium]|nr:ABC transporter permease [Gemmatimonadaceae bacterium]